MNDGDLVIRGGLVYDGSGAPPVRADVMVSRGRISEVRPTRSRGAAGHPGPTSGGARVIDATGLAVCPGFVDVHSHSDRSLLVNPLAESKVRQGVTTEVIGNCGDSLVPLTEHNREVVLGNMERLGIEAQWADPAGYLEVLEGSGTSVNVVALVGHGTVRSAVMGFAMRKPSDSEAAQMKDLLRRCMDDGFAGMSSGLIYPPGAYASTSELVELARVVADRGGIYASHVRGEREEVVEAVGEAIEIGRMSGAPVQVSHLKAAGRRNWGKMSRVLARIEEARSEGVDVAADQYPYTASATTLTAVLPAWVQSGGREATLARLRDPAVRARIEAEIEAREEVMQGWDEVCIAGVATEENRPLVGRFLVDIARERGMSPAAVVTSLLLEERLAVDMVLFSMSEDDVREAMRKPFVMVGSDGSALAPYGPLGRDRPHPRSYGAFPRMLGKYSFRERVIPPEEAIRKMTSLPAGRLGLSDRGFVKAGYAADLVVFDPVTILDTATFERPASYPEGIMYVIVNGRITVALGTHLGARNGMILRRSA